MCNIFLQTTINVSEKGIFSYRRWICIDLSRLIFGLFAGCYNSPFSYFGPMPENPFLIWYFKHVLGNLFAFILASLFLAILRRALLCYCSFSCFL